MKRPRGMIFESVAVLESVARGRGCLGPQLYAHGRSTGRRSNRSGRINRSFIERRRRYEIEKQRNNVNITCAFWVRSIKSQNHACACLHIHLTSLPTFQSTSFISALVSFGKAWREEGRRVYSTSSHSDAVGAVGGPTMFRVS
jgi:hypothetical protein